MDNNEIFEFESIETEITETIPQKPYPLIWYVMTDDKDRIVDMRNSNQIYSVNPDVWHELNGVAYGKKFSAYDEDGNEIADDTLYISALYDDSGVPLYKFIGGDVIERSEEELAADIPESVPVPPSNAELADTLLEHAEFILDLDFRTSCLELGIN